MATANIKAVITAEDRASATLGTFGNNVDTTAVKMTNAFKVAAAAAAALAVAGIGMAVKASWDQVDAVQQATVALKAYERDGSKVNKVLSELVGYARSDMGVLFNRKDLFQSAQSLKLMGDNTGDLVNHVKILSRSVGLGLSNWQELNLIVGRVGSTGRLTGEDFDNLTKAGYKLDPAIRNTDQSFQSLFDHLNKGIPADALAGQADTIQGKMIRLQTAFRNIGDTILGVDRDTGQFIKGGLGDIMVQSITAVTEGIKQFIQVVNQVAVFLKPVTDYIMQNKQAIELLRVSLIAIISIIAAFIIIIGVGIVGAVAVVSGAIQGLFNLINWGFDVFMNFINAVNSVINWLGQLGSSALQAMGQFGNAIGSGINNAVNWFTSLPGRILGAIGNMGSLLYNVGKSIVDGLVRGIQDVAANIGRALGNASNDAVKQVKNILGIHSPSTVFAGIGQNMAEGMIQGIEGSTDRIASATSGMVDVPQYSTSPKQGGTTILNVTFNGVFTSSEIEMRKLAEKVFNARQDAMNMNGQMI